MSQLKQAAALDVLKHLAEHGETEQKGLDKLIEKCSRTVIRVTKALENQGLIQFVRHRRAFQRGKPRNVWKISFEGLLWFIFIKKDIVTLNDLAKKHQDEWIIFQEWEHIRSIEEVRSSCTNRLFIDLEEVFSDESAFDPMITDYNSDRQLDEMSVKMGLFKDRQNAVELYNEYLKTRAARIVLGLDDIFDLSSNLLAESTQYTHIDYLTQNENLRMFIRTQLEKAKQNQSRLNRIENILKVYED